MQIYYYKSKMHSYFKMSCYKLQAKDKKWHR